MPEHEDFRRLAPLEQQNLMVDAGHLVSAITRLGVADNGRLTAIAVHGPTLTEVPGVPLVGRVLRGFGLWFSVLRGNVRKPDLELLKSMHPEFLWLPADQLARELRRDVTTDDTQALSLSLDPTSSLPPFVVPPPMASRATDSIRRSGPWHT